MLLKIYEITLLYLASLTVRELQAKPGDNTGLAIETKCDDLVWSQDKENEWIVKKRQNSPRNSGLKVWWPSLGRCVDLTKAKTDNLCPNGEPALNSRMEGSCNCSENAGAIEGKEGCHLYYDQGPCPKGEIVTFDENVKRAVCSKDFCAKKNEGAIEFSKRHVPINGTCYEMTSKEPCEISEYIEISPNVPKCVSFAIEHQTFADFPNICLVKNEPICRLKVIIEDDQMKRINQLKEDLNK